MKKLKEVRKEIEEIGGPKHHQKALVKRVLDRFKGMSKDLAWRVAHATKPGKMINSKLYVELGDLWDKGKKRDFEKHLAKNESVEEKSKELSYMKKRQLIKHYNDLGKGKLSALDKIKKLLKDDVNESINEDKFQLVNMSRNTARHADKLAKRVGLDTDFEGGVLGINLTVHGTKKKIEKWLHSLPLDNVDEGKGTDVFNKYNKVIGRMSDKEQGEILDALYTMNTKSGSSYKKAWGKVKELLNMEYVPEGMYTRDDGGAYDGLRIAKYLAHQDGKKWKGMPYGTLSSYIDKGMDMLKRNKSKAREILSKPTPRGY